jgi:UDP-GlcNAc:undecaprenyl-phosphate GlcNAc-1-phosphate transferase
MLLIRFLVPFGIAFLISLLLGPWAARAGRRLKAMDQPERLKLHAEPVARSGGLAIGAGLVAGGWAGAPLAGILHQAELLRLAGVTLAAAVAFLVGFLDDMMDLRPRHKLAGQLLPPLLLTMLALGVRGHHPLYLAAPLTFVLILGAMNSVNLLDGMDGLAAGVTTVGALALAAFLGSSGSHLAAAWALALAGAAAGFLVFNIHPARLFMGDGGSFLCGFGLAYAALEVLDRVLTPRAVLVVLLMLAPPIIDTTLTAGRRVLAGRPLAVADQQHTYHLLLRRGLRQRGVFAIFVCAALASSCAALILGRAPRALMWLAGGCGGSALLVALFRPWARRLEPDGTRAAGGEPASGSGA